MRRIYVIASLSLLAGASAQLLDIPAVDQVVESALSSLAAYTAYNGPTGSAASALASETAAANPTRQGNVVLDAAVDDPPYWLADISHQGVAAFNSNPSGYTVFRNVKDYGAKGMYRLLSIPSGLLLKRHVGDGVTDDTAAINAAISAGSRKGPGSRESSTTTPAIVYFPAGTYLISSSIIDYYFTQLIGNPNSLPIIKATPGFTGLGLIDGDQYQSDGNQGWTSTGVFYRQIRNLIIDMTAIPASSAATGIHWPTGQATSIQNVKIYMNQNSGTQHQGLFIENGKTCLTKKKFELRETWLNWYRLWRFYQRSYNHRWPIWCQHRKSTVYYAQPGHFKCCGRNIPDMGLGLDIPRDHHYELHNGFLNEQWRFQCSKCGICQYHR